MSAWRSVPLRLTDHPEFGGRWTSLRGPEREWLWANPDPLVRSARRTVRPGDPFVDAGGVEECLPTVRGAPDHGDVWTRSWARPGSGAAEVTFDLVANGCLMEATLRRAIHEEHGVIQLAYDVTGPPGASFMHAVHALLQLGPEARLHAQGDFEAVVLDQPGPGDVSPICWPSGLDLLGPDDGSASCVILLGCASVDVVDGEDRLSLTWSADDPELCSLMLWRNLGGWPQPGPYRSIGVEPMVGRTADLNRGQASDLARIGADGSFHWSLTVSASRRHTDAEAGSREDGADEPATACAESLSARSPGQPGRLVRMG